MVVCVCMRVERLKCDPYWPGLQLSAASASRAPLLISQPAIAHPPAIWNLMTHGRRRRMANTHTSSGEVALLGHDFFLEINWTRKHRWIAPDWWMRPGWLRALAWSRPLWLQLKVIWKLILIAMLYFMLRNSRPIKSGKLAHGTKSSTFLLRVRWAFKKRFLYAHRFMKTQLMSLVAIQAPFMPSTSQRL